MKVLIIIPEISKSGGTERATVNLANMLRAQLHEVHLISISSKKSSASFYQVSGELIIQHLDLPRIPLGIFKKISWNKEAISLCKDYVKHFMPDVIIGQGHNINSLLPFLRIGTSMRLYGCEHIDFDTIPKSSKIIIKLIYRFLDGVIVLSEHARRKLKSVNKKVLIIPNSLSFFPKITSSLDQKRILMVGRLSPEKGYDRLTDVAKNLIVKYPDWKIEIFGAGDEKGALERKYMEGGLGNYITIHDPVRDIEAEYLKSSIVLLTSHTEALPMVVLEAHSCGVPVIGYACEGTLQLICDGKNGFIIGNGDAEEMANKVSCLIDDLELRISMGRRGRLDSNSYSFNSIAKKWDLLLKGELI